MKRKRGRPVGSKTRHRPAVVAILSACPACGSTDRTPYRRLRTVRASGAIEGQRFNQIVTRATCCAACGTERSDVCYELSVRPPDAAIALARAALQRAKERAA